MKNLLKQIFDEEKIEYFAFVRFSSCRIINERLMERSVCGWTPATAIMLLIPYYSGEHSARNVSLYAVARDYHLYFRQMYERVVPRLKEAFPNNNFVSFADHSPIGETYAAAIGGLGVIGDKYQLINEKYGSHVFIGEILTDYIPDSYDDNDVKFCEHCSLCNKKCPSQDVCFSEITQKKGELSASEAELIKKQKCVWGCDVCRTVCPHNSNVALTPIEFFKEDLITYVTDDMIHSMSKEEFKSRAYGWRGKQTIIRNIKILEEQ
jgi:epoxyqueuosine reductase QueG